MNKNKKNNREGFQASRFEHRAYGAYFFGENFLWGFAGMLAIFITDTGLGAAVVATILLIPKIWDAINDTIFGILIDKVKLKSGQKFLPWMRIGTFALGFTTILLFAVPKGLSDGYKIAWIIIAYLLFDTAYTMLDAPLFALPTAMTVNIQERTAILANGRFFAMVAGMAGGLAIPLIRPKVGWLPMAIIVVIISIATMLPLMLKGQERHSASEEKEPGISFKEMGIYLKTNNQLLVVLVTMFVIGVTGVEMILSIHVARICFGSEAMAAVIVMISAIPSLFIAKMVPSFAKKVDKSHLFLGGMIISTVAGVLMFLTGYTNMITVIIFTVFKSIGLTAYNIIAYMFIADSVEYGTYKTGTRATGISFALQTFTAKLRGALVTSLALFSLSLVGFVSGENAVQGSGVANGVWGIYTLLPALGYFIAALVFSLFYKLRDNTVQVMAKYNMGEISAEEAEATLKDKFGKPGKVVMSENTNMKQNAN